MKVHTFFLPGYFKVQEAPETEILNPTPEAIKLWKPEQLP